MVTDWKNLYKVRLSNNSGNSMDKHDIVKLLIVRRLLEKYRKHRSFIRIYTEFQLENGRKCDVYFENMRTKEVYAYEIQKSATPLWLKEVREAYRDWNVFLFKTSDLVIVELKKLPDDINELKEQLEEYIL